MNLQRFHDAQRDSYAGALMEVRAGRKTSHWMWYIFPQLGGLGFSATSAHYAIADLDEARAYLEDPVLGARLREITRAALDHADRLEATDIFGSVDAQKLRSCWTLFNQVDPASERLFEQGLTRFFGGRADPRTLQLLGLDAS